MVVTLGVTTDELYDFGHRDATMYLYAGGKDTLYRINGTNQPEWIGHAISSGCIRLTNEDVIDLYNRVKTGALVVVLGPKQGPARVASAGSSDLN